MKNAVALQSTKRGRNLCTNDCACTADTKQVACSALGQSVCCSSSCTMSFAHAQRPFQRPPHSSCPNSVALPCTLVRHPLLLVLQMMRRMMLVNSQCVCISPERRGGGQQQQQQQMPCWWYHLVKWRGRARQHGCKQHSRLVPSQPNGPKTVRL